MSWRKQKKDFRNIFIHQSTESTGMSLLTVKFNKLKVNFEGESVYLSKKSFKFLHWTPSVVYRMRRLNKCFLDDLSYGQELWIIQTITVLALQVSNKPRPRQLWFSVSANKVSHSHVDLKPVNIVDLHTHFVNCTSKRAQIVLKCLHAFSDAERS